MENNEAANKVKKAVKDLTDVVKDNKGAAIGMALGYLFADTLKEKNGVAGAILGGLVGNVVDEKSKDKKKL